MDVKNAPKHIGVIGGMGPRATLQFLEHIIEYSQETYGAKRDEEFPRISMESIPLPGFTASALPEQMLVQNTLRATYERLESVGASVVGIPCNTVHGMLAEIQEMGTVPIVNLVEETAREAKLRGLTRGYILATRMTLDARLYNRAYAANNPSAQAITPSENSQHIVDQLITTVEEGGIVRDVAELLKEARELGADHIVLGCTELSLIPAEFFHAIKTNDMVILDSSLIGAQRLVDFAYSNTSVASTTTAPVSSETLQEEKSLAQS